MRCTSEEYGDFERTLHISQLCIRQLNTSNFDRSLRTSTSSKTATTNTSKSEFFHPTRTPGAFDFGMSRGQNILIKPSCSGMAEIVSE